MSTEFTIVSLHPIPNFMQSLANFVNHEEFAVGHLTAYDEARLIARLRQSCQEGTAAGFWPRNFRPKALFFDMDSTVIGQETIVELAREARRADEVAAITEQAMAGKLDFAESLKRRVGVLAGLSTSIFAETQPHLIVEPGMRDLVHKATYHRVPCYLISGGFCEMAEKIAKEVGFTDFHANRLRVENSKLTGEVEGKIVDGQGKADWLTATCHSLGINPRDAVAIGDGANDAAMMQVAGLAVGYNPKQVLLPLLHGINRSGTHRFLEYFLFSDFPGSR